MKHATRLSLGLLALVACSTGLCAQNPGKLEFLVHDKTGQPVPCRIHLLNALGKPVKPLPAPSWNDHFVCPGTATLTLPAGLYSYEIERGPEHARVSGRVDVPRGASAVVKALLERQHNMPAEGWWPGELHVHRPVEHMELLMRAEDLHIAPVITWWNKRNQWGSEKRLPDNPLIRFDGNRYYDVMGGEDEREGGALLYFHLKKPLNFAVAAKEYPSPMKFLKEARGLSKDVWVDVEKPFWWDFAVWLASGLIDTIGLANNHMCRSQMYESEAWGKPRDVKRLPPPQGNGYWTQEVYYHVLNTGLRIPPSAGSASGVLPNPVGYNRVYVQVGDELNYQKWWEGLKAGRSFVTNGPLLRVQADGQWPGYVFKAPKGKELMLDLNVNLSSADPIRVIQVIENGKVAQQITAAEVAKGKTLEPIKFRSSGWFLVRALVDNPKTFRFASTAPFHVEIGDNKTRISKASTQFFLGWCRERMTRIKLDDPGQRREVLEPHLQAERFWLDRLAKANVE